MSNDKNNEYNATLKPLKSGDFLDGPNDPDFNDYGFVSPETNDFYRKYMENASKAVPLPRTRRSAKSKTAQSKSAKKVKAPIVDKACEGSEDTQPKPEMQRSQTAAPIDSEALHQEANAERELQKPIDQIPDKLDKSEENTTKGTQDASAAFLKTDPVDNISKVAFEQKVKSPAQGRERDDDSDQDDSTDDSESQPDAPSNKRKYSECDMSDSDSSTDSDSDQEQQKEHISKKPGWKEDQKDVSLEPKLKKMKMNKN
ncbi:hypothetical protein AWZ03_007225 [Drosophila navojoa]|uniref:Uncharacterized protein n=1 Tax=Drosophila navojoa TaxID=7232 RepID=A0A484BBW9_DRONA|nr:hypothetical protein AWZ03_007225 [Drosophila navojoa]